MLINCMLPKHSSQLSIQVKGNDICSALSYDLWQQNVNLRKGIAQKSCQVNIMTEM